MQDEDNERTLLHERAAAGDDLAQERAAITQAEKTLRVQRAELLRMMAELKKVQEAVRRQHLPELEALRKENAELRQALAEAEAGPAARELHPTSAQELEGLRAERELLRKLLAEKDSLLEELRQRPETPASREPIDTDTLEAELNQHRRQLEEERRKLAEEREQMRLRNQELDEATRELEMDHSRERAELARERTRLERLRDEVKAELERIQRDADVMSRLAPVQRLREQLVDRKSNET
jgi:hypothetical protein